MIGEGHKNRKTHQEELGERKEKAEGTGHEGEFGSKGRSVATGHRDMHETKQDRRNVGERC